MTIIDLLRREFALMRHHVTGIIQGLTKGELLWTPPRVANPIGSTLLHAVTGEDRLIQSVLQGKPSLWEAGRWYEQIGGISLPVRGHDWIGVDLTSYRRQHFSLTRRWSNRPRRTTCTCSTTLIWRSKLRSMDKNKRVPKHFSRSSSIIRPMLVRLPR